MGPSGPDIGANLGWQAVLAFGYTVFGNYKDPCDNRTMTRKNAPHFGARQNLTKTCAK